MNALLPESVYTQAIPIACLKHQIRNNIIYLLVDAQNYDAFFDLCDDVKGAIERLGFDAFVVEMEGYPGSRRRYNLGLADRLS